MCRATVAAGRRMLAPVVRLPSRARALCLGLVLSGCGARSELLTSGAPTHTGGGHVPPAPSCATSAPVPTVLYTNAIANVRYLAIDADAVYLGDPFAFEYYGAPALTRVPKCGGPAVTLAVPQGHIADPVENVAVAAGNVAWWAEHGAGGNVSVVPAAPGGQARLLASFVEQPTRWSFSIGLDADHVFYGEKSAVKSVPLAGGTPTSLASGRSIIAAVNDVNVYFFQWPPTGTALASVPKSGGDVTFLGPSLNYPLAYTVHDAAFGNFAQDDDAIYWSDGGVMRVPKSGGPAEVVASEATGSFVVDDTHVYFVVIAKSVIRRVPKTGGSAETFVTLPPDPWYSALAVDAKSLYWWQGHSLMKLDK